MRLPCKGTTNKATKVYSIPLYAYIKTIQFRLDLYSGTNYVLLTFGFYPFQILHMFMYVCMCLCIYNMHMHSLLT